MTEPVSLFARLMPEEGLTGATPVINLPTGLDTKRSRNTRRQTKQTDGEKLHANKRATKSLKDKSEGAMNRQEAECSDGAGRCIRAVKYSLYRRYQMLSARDKTALFIKQPLWSS